MKRWRTKPASLRGAGTGPGGGQSQDCPLITLNYGYWVQDKHSPNPHAASAPTWARDLVDPIDSSLLSLQRFIPALVPTTESRTPNGIVNASFVDIQNTVINLDLGSRP